MAKTKSNTAAALSNLMHTALEVHEHKEPVAQKETPPARPIAQAPEARTCTFRLTGPEVLKINAVALATHQSTGARLTTTDILHIALKGLPEAAVSREEVELLRAQDKRRRQL